MSEFLYSIDLALFYFINHTLANPVFDVVIPFLTDLNQWRPFQAALVLFLVYFGWKGGAKARVTIGLLVLTIILSDQLNSVVLKSLFSRVRPCKALTDVHLLVGCGGFSFPSSHATNNFAAATVITRFYSRRAWGWWSFAGLMAFTRPYVGVHYPSDVLAGALVGFIVGSLVVLGWKLLNKRFKFLPSVTAANSL